MRFRKLWSFIYVRPIITTLCARPRSYIFFGHVDLIPLYCCNGKHCFCFDQAFCRLHDSHLIHVNDELEDSFIKTKLKDLQGNTFRKMCIMLSLKSYDCLFLFFFIKKKLKLVEMCCFIASRYIYLV